jgi:hypothetical protein
MSARSTNRHLGNLRSVPESPRYQKEFGIPTFLPRNQVFPRVKITFWHTSQSVVADWADNHAYDVLGVKAALHTREAAFQDLQFTVIFLLTHADYD